MGVVYIGYHCLIVVFGISDWMCHFSIGHSMSIIYDNNSVFFLFFLLYDVVVFLLANFSIAHSVYRSVMFWYFLFAVSTFVIIPQTWPI